MSARNPRKDPLSGDVIEYRIGNSSYWGRHTVYSVIDGIVRYWDEGLLDHVPLEKWRKWYVGRRNVRVTASKRAAS